MPSSLFGREGYAVLMGRIAMPTFIAQAASPSIGAWLLGAFGATATLEVLFGATVVNIALVLALVPFARKRRCCATSWVRKAPSRPNVKLSNVQHLACYGGAMAHIRLTLTMNSGARIGLGKAELLESVQSSGSISAAARTMGMDYKRAWLLVDSINRAFAVPAVERVTGGTGGGGAVLTAFGRDLLARYRRLETLAAQMAADDLEALEQQAAPDAGPKV